VPVLTTIPKEQVSYLHQRPPDRYDPARNLKILLRQLDEAEKAGGRVEPRTLAYIGTELMAKQQWAEAGGFRPLPWLLIRTSSRGGPR
jgi:hypothetical protein